MCDSFQGLFDDCSLIPTDECYTPLGMYNDTRQTISSPPKRLNYLYCKLVFNEGECSEENCESSGGICESDEEYLNPLLDYCNIPRGFTSDVNCLGVCTTPKKFALNSTRGTCQFGQTLGWNLLFEIVLTLKENTSAWITILRTIVALERI